MFHFQGYARVVSVTECIQRNLPFKQRSLRMSRRCFGRCGPNNRQLNRMQWRCAQHDHRTTMWHFRPEPGNRHRTHHNIPFLKGPESYFSVCKDPQSRRLSDKAWHLDWYSRLFEFHIFQGSGTRRKSIVVSFHLYLRYLVLVRDVVLVRCVVLDPFVLLDRVIVIDQSIVLDWFVVLVWCIVLIGSFIPFNIVIFDKLDWCHWRICVRHLQRGAPTSVREPTHLYLLIVRSYG